MSLDIHTDPPGHDVEYVDVKKGAIEADVPNRVYNIWAATAWQVLMMTSWTCNIILFDTVFDIGGPMMLIYSTVIVTIGQSLLMASLAEMCSIWPYAGGQQVFTQKLAPHSARRFLSYLVGWILFLGETATAASCTMNSVQVIVGVVQITYANWEATRWLEWLIYTGLTVFALLLSLSQRHLPGLALIGGFIVIAGGIAWVISFLAMAPKHSAEFVFTEFINNSGYESRGWVGIMSFYTPMYALYGTDGILHVTEEMKNPERDAPRAMLWAMIISGTSMFISGIVMGFCAGDWEAYMQTDIPYVTWFVDIYHSTAGGITLVVIICIVINFLITVGLNTAASRLAWGMARDNALPFSSVFVRINHKVQTPVNTILLTAAAQLVIGLVVFGSNYAFQVIISICLVAIQLGYLIPTLLVVIRGRKLLPTPRAFDLGVAGWPINIFSVCWCLLVIVMLFFPLYIPVNGANIYNMNWAIVLIAGVILVVFIDWVLRARHHYYYGN